ncbi:MAG TPA: GC-type dockerin domain-anchored protein [Phycisphaerales bacterium]|nr:GC-type dockerin domain-anchored protein [Phycisphaerales bacterium]
MRICQARAVASVLPVFLVAGFAGECGAQVIAIGDAGFETAAVSACGFVSNISSGTHPVWQPTNGGEVGIWDPGTCWDMTPPEGQQIAYSNGGGAKQVLGTAAIAGTTYTLSAKLGRRGNPCCPFSSATLELWAGNTQFGLRTVTAAQAPAAGAWQTYTLVATTPAGLGAGQLLQVRFGAAGTQVNFDDLRLVVGGTPVCPADIGGTGGLPGADGVLNNNDFVVFIDRFFAHAPSADIGTTGGVPGSDGVWNNNDFVVFIDQFFAGC